MCRLQQHGNAVGLKGVYEDAHNVYIVMEECRGGDLEQLMEVRIPAVHAVVLQLQPRHKLDAAVQPRQGRQCWDSCRRVIDAVLVLCLLVRCLCFVRWCVVCALR